MSRATPLVVALTFATCLVACDEGDRADRPDRPARPPAEPPRPSARARPEPSATSSTDNRATAPPAESAGASAKPFDADQQCSPADTDAAPLEIVKFALTSKLEKRKPTDELTIVKPGTTIYAYLVVKNLSTTPRCALVTFRVNGRQRASLTLDIGTSPTWRTWAQITPAKGDAPGNVEVEITDDHGRQRYRQKVLIEPEA